jgi:hypothetical protein
MHAFCSEMHMKLFPIKQKTCSFAFLAQVVWVGHLGQLHMLLYFSKSLLNCAGDVPFTSFIICSNLSIVFHLFLRVQRLLHDCTSAVLFENGNGFSSFSQQQLWRFPLNLWILPPGNYSMGFSQSVQVFVQEILSNVFPASDFETKSATTGVGFILPCSVSGSPGNGYI